MVSLKGALMTKLRLSDEGPHLVVITAHLDAHSLDIRLAQLKQIMTELVHKVRSFAVL
jgi:endonuclease/exonuclease/phosphatase family metal-dependent hydrolase